MNQTLAGTAMDWLVESTGECDRTKLFTWLNQCRERMYQLYADLPLFEISECFELQTFSTDCDRCTETYRGVTLPREYQTVEALWFNDYPVVLRSSWREYQHGMSPCRSCTLEKFDMPGLYSSERDIVPRSRQKLFVVALHPQDVGKVATIRGFDVNGKETAQDLTLALEPVYTDYAMRSLHRGAGFTKTRTIGGVVLGEEGGRILSVYGPDETTPGYKRIKITGLHQGCEQVNIRASRRFFPVFRESDVIETDNRTAFEEMGRFLRLNKKQNKSGTDIQSASFAFAQAKAALMGDKAREIGKGTLGEVQVESIGFGPARLGGW